MKYCKTLWHILKHRKTSWTTLKTLWSITKYSLYDATISALDPETSALGAETSALVRSFRQYRRGVSGKCGVGITPQMCNRVTNHGDMDTFSKPGDPFLAKKFNSPTGELLFLFHSNFQKLSFLLCSKKHCSCFVTISKMYRQYRSWLIVTFQKASFLLRSKIDSLFLASLCLF